MTFKGSTCARLLLLVTALLDARAEEPSPTPAPAGPAEPVKLTLRGVWVADADGKPTSPGRFTRGLQTSGLLFRKGELWSVGDQRSEYPGHLFRIDPGTARLIGKPIRLEVPAVQPGENPELEAYRGIRNSDFEGFALHPRDPDAIYAVTEDKVPWLATVRLAAAGGAGAAAGPDPTARIAQLSRIVFPDDAEPWNGDLNFRMEGCAVSDDARTLYLAFERAKDALPRIYRMDLESARSGAPLSLERVPISFASVAPRRDKEKARLNLNDIQFLRHKGRAALLCIARDQERIILIDLDGNAVLKVIDLDLLDPSGQPIEWVSPEGLAIDPEGGRLWMINDPDSVGQSYRARAESAPSGLFAEYSPLLYELKLADVLR